MSSTNTEKMDVKPQEEPSPKEINPFNNPPLYNTLANASGASVSPRFPTKRMTLTKTVCTKCGIKDPTGSKCPHKAAVFTFEATSERLVRKRSFAEMNGLEGRNSISRFCSMLETGFYADCKIITEDCEIRVHKFILAVMSPVMEKALCGPMGKDEYHVNFPTVVMKKILQHIYHQQVKMTNRTDVEALLTAAHYFQLTELVNTCGVYLRPKTTKEFVTALNTACFFHVTSLKESCIEFALMDLPNIMVSNITPLSSVAMKYFVEKVNNAPGLNHKNFINKVCEWATNKKATGTRCAVHLRNALEDFDLFDKLKFYKLKESDLLSGEYHQMFTKEELVDIHNKRYRERVTPMEEYVRGTGGEFAGNTHQRLSSFPLPFFGLQAYQGHVAPAMNLIHAGQPANGAGGRHVVAAAHAAGHGIAVQVAGNAGAARDGAAAVVQGRHNIMAGAEDHHGIRPRGHIRRPVIDAFIHEDHFHIHHNDLNRPAQHN